MTDIIDLANLLCVGACPQRVTVILHNFLTIEVFSQDLAELLGSAESIIYAPSPFLPAARCAAVFDARAATPILSSSCGLPPRATRAILTYFARQSSMAFSAASCSRVACWAAPLAASCRWSAEAKASIFARSEASFGAS